VDTLYSAVESVADASGVLHYVALENAWDRHGRKLACMWGVEHYDGELMDRNAAVHTAL